VAEEVGFEPRRWPPPPVSENHKPLLLVAKAASVYCTFTALRCKSLITNGAGEGNRTLVTGKSSQMLIPFTPMHRAFSMEVSSQRRPTGVNGMSISSNFAEAGKKEEICFSRDPGKPRMQKPP